MNGPDEIAVRACTQPLRKKAATQRNAGRVNDQPSKWALIFDCETTIDAAQRLRFGAYQVRKYGELAEEGVFFDPEALDADELARLADYTNERGLACREVSDFTERVFLRIGYDRRGTIIGFNLPFDISRIAIGHDAARGSMRGGFTFRLSPYKSRPHVRVKHLSRRAALIDFAKPGVQETARSSRKRGIQTPAHRGFFADVSTIAAALLSDGFSLAALCERLGTATRKAGTEGHGAALTDAYLDYARTDVQATWECYAALQAQYQSHRLSAPLHRILSEASVGKAYLTQMGIESLLTRQPNVPPDLLGKIMCAYYGGRAEVRWRRVIRRVAYCDFKSMYPTVNALMGLSRFVIADGFAWRDGTDEARRVLASADAATFQNPAAWRDLIAIVRVQPDNDLFPVRAEYDGRVHTIGLNHLTYDGELWMTLADCVVAKLLSGKAPVIEEAIAFEPGPPQAGLKPIDLFGDAAYRVDPLQDDVFKRFVDLRDAARANSDPLQQAIKIIANATSYGIFIEINRDDAPKSEPIAVYGPDGVRREIGSKAIEEPGRFFHPLLGVLITGAARLMLALAERRVLDMGLDWAFCDTDSLAIVKPDGMDEAVFRDAVQSVIEWFAPLNPYAKPGSILKLEECNYALSPDGEPSEELAPLHCFAISAKRYALFNIDADGRPVIRKASAHGLGHLLPPYRAEDAPISIPKPAAPLADIGVERWQYDLWYKIIEATLAGRPDQVRLDYHPALQAPATGRFGMTSPRLAAWMRFRNAGRDYADQARPYGFMLTMQAKENGGAALDAIADKPKRGRPRKSRIAKPIAPFHRDPAKAAQAAFDRETGEPVPADQLKTYADALAQYHLHPEDKFLNADFRDRGRTRRRHVVAKRVRLIGKEANKWEEEALAHDHGVAQFGNMVEDEHRLLLRCTADRVSPDHGSG